jgi:4-hydroxy-4-methyl-2-oxoglutarate aldolase
MDRTQNMQPEDAARGLSRSHVAMVSDALDLLGHRNQVLAPGIVPLGSARVVGRAFPIQIAAVDRIPSSPYSGEMSAIETIAPGEVLVYGGDVTHAAVFGELFAHAALAKGAVGAIVDGYIRDAQQLVDVGFPVFSRGMTPLDTSGRAEVVAWGERTVCAGVEVVRGDFVAADMDGIAIVPAAIVTAVIDAISSRRRNEDGARTDIIAGVGVRDVWDRWRAF